MIFRKLGLLHRGQRGFTFIETLTALIIIGLMGVGAAVATVQVLTQSTTNNNYTTASRHTMNAIHWISRDAMMAQTVEPDGASGFPLTLRWINWDNSTHQVIYNVIPQDGELRRGYSVDGGVPSNTMVAQYIDPAAEATNCKFAGGTLALQVTAIVGEGSNEISVTKVCKLSPRPGL